MFEKLAIIVSVIVLTISAYGWGLPFARWNQIALERVEQVGLRLLFGFGLLGTLLFLVGSFRFNLAVIVVLVVAGLVFNLFEVKQFIADLKNTVAALFDLKSQELLFLVPTVALLAFLAIASLAPQVGALGNDTTRYHLLGPVVWLREGVIRPVLDSSHTAFPAIIETLLAAVSSLSGSDNPCLLTVLFAAVLLTQVWGIAKSLGSSDWTAWLSVCLTVAMPVMMVRAGTGYVDIAYSGFVLAATRLALFRSDYRNFALAGAFAGFAMGTKYTGLVMLAGLLLVFLITELLANNLKKAISLSAILGTIAVLIACPWYLRNLIQLGTPIYPPPTLLAKFLPAKAFPFEASARFEQFMLRWGRGFGRTLIDLLLLPVRFTFATDVFHGALAGIGIVPLAMAPVGIFRVRKYGLTVKKWLLWCAVMTVIWFYTNQDFRFGIHVIAVMTVFAAIGADVLKSQIGQYGRRLAFLTILISFLYCAQSLIQLRADAFRAALLPAFARQRAKLEIPSVAAYDYLNNNPEVKRVLLLHPGLQPYYLHKPYVKVTGNLGEVPDEDIGTPQKALKKVCQLGVTHIFDAKLKELSYPDEKYSDAFQIPDQEINRADWSSVFTSNDAHILKVHCQSAK